MRLIHVIERYLSAHSDEASDVICFQRLLFPSVTFALPLGQLWLCHQTLIHSFEDMMPSLLLKKKKLILMRRTFTLHVENRMQKALIKWVIKKYGDIHTLVTTDPKPRPRCGSQQFCTRHCTSSQPQPALSNTHQTHLPFQTATGKGWAGNV